MRRPGFEPGSQPWQGQIIPLNHRRMYNEWARPDFRLQDERLQFSNRGSTPVLTLVKTQWIFDTNACKGAVIATRPRAHLLC